MNGKLNTIFVDGTETLVYTVESHMGPSSRQDIMNKLKEVFPSTKIVVIFADDTLLTHIPNK